MALLFYCLHTFQCLDGNETERLPITYENMPIQIYVRIHACSNILKILPPKNENSNIFHVSAQNIDCAYSLEPPRRGGSNEYPQSIF